MLLLNRDIFSADTFNNKTLLILFSVFHFIEQIAWLRS